MNRPAAALHVALGAIVGAALRWVVIETFETNDGWPWAILGVNLVGSFALGVVLAATHLTTDAHVDVASGSDPLPRSARLRLGVGTGFCGALTTFSTFAVDAAEILRDGDTTSSIGYVGVSLGAGIVAFVLGRTSGPLVSATSKVASARAGDAR